MTSARGTSREIEAGGNYNTPKTRGEGRASLLRRASPQSRLATHLHEAFSEERRVEQRVGTPRHLQCVRHVVHPKRLGTLRQLEHIAKQLFRPDLTQETVSLQIQQAAVEELQKPSKYITKSTQTASFLWDLHQ